MGGWHARRSDKALTKSLSFFMGFLIVTPFVAFIIKWLVT